MRLVKGIALLITAGLLQVSSVGASYYHPSNRVSSPMLTLGANLVINGDAEAGQGSNDASVVPVPGWTVTSNFTAVEYGTVTVVGPLPSPTSPGPLERGKNFFAGGLNNRTAQASQDIDVTAQAVLIDTGGSYFMLSGYLGGYQNQGDNIIVTATFKDITGNQLAQANIGPVNNVDRDNITGLLYRRVSGKVPSGTRTITIEMNSSRVTGTHNDGYADNISLILYDENPLPTVYLPLLSR